jgi:hypothetical protein
MAQGFGCIAYRQSNSEYNDSCDREYQLTADIIYKELARFCTPWKLISYAGLVPSTRDWKNIKARFSLAEMDIGSICNDCSKI